jgi:carbon storage regulator CsrA
MLVLSRKKYERIVIGDDISVTVTDIKDGKVCFEINAPRDVELSLHCDEYIRREKVDPE